MREIHKVVTIVIVASVLFCKIMFAIADGYPKAASEPTPTPDYPEWTAVDTTEIELETFEGPGFQMQCPAGKWGTSEELAEEYGMPEFMDDALGLYYKETALDENMIILGVGRIGESTPLLENEQKELAEGFSNELGWTVLESEMYLFDGITVGFIELEAVYTEQLLEKALADGRITEETLELGGGREAWLSLPTGRELFMSFTKDGYAYNVVGIYSEPQQKQIVLDAMTIALQTLESTE